MLLSVSTSDGTLSHLGSLHGKDFLQDKDNIKFQFLTHCLKSKIFFVLVYRNVHIKFRIKLTSNLVSEYFPIKAI